jgi:hypothetical protein
LKLLFYKFSYRDQGEKKEILDPVETKDHRQDIFLIQPGLDLFCILIFRGRLEKQAFQGLLARRAKKVTEEMEGCLGTL